MVDFLDVNVWIALTTQEHPHHERAATYFKLEAQPILGFCRITALAYIRITTQRHTVGGEPLSLSEAWENYQKLLALQEVRMFFDPDRLDEVMENWIEQGLASTKTFTDLYLAAFAKAGSFRLVTFDKDFQRFPGLDLLHLNSNS